MIAQSIRTLLNSLSYTRLTITLAQTAKSRDALTDRADPPSKSALLLNLIQLSLAVKDYSNWGALSIYGVTSVPVRKPRNRR
jgi:hypothetical protein